MKDASFRFACEQSPYEAALMAIYGLGSAAVLALSVWQFEQGAMALGTFIGIVLFLFQLFGPLKDLYQQSTRLTIMESALDRIEKLFAQKELDDNGKTILPASKDISLASDTTPESASPVLGTVQHEIDRW